MEWWPRVNSLRWRLALKGVWRCRVVCGTQGGDEVVWLALELKGRDGGACELLGYVGVKVEVAYCTQRKVSSVPFVFSIPFVLSRDGSISTDSFFSFILLLLVMVVAIIRVVIVVTILGVVVVDIVGGVPSIVKLSNGSFNALGQSPDKNFHNQVVKFILHFPDFSSRTILIGQEPFQFSPGDLVGLLYSNRVFIAVANRVLVVVEKKKKDGGSLGADETPILGGIAMHVMNIDGKMNVPKSILKKAARNVLGIKCTRHSHCQERVPTG
nr:hypothetical protein [Tanacetum cinerariifolium]